MENNIPEISRRIRDLYSILKIGNSSIETARKINDVLIYAEKVPIRLLSPAWQLFAKEKGMVSP